MNLDPAALDCGAGEPYLRYTLDESPGYPHVAPMFAAHESSPSFPARQVAPKPGALIKMAKPIRAAAMI